MARTRSGFRALLTFIAICSSLIVTSSMVVQAQARNQTGLTLKAQAGFDGYARESSWIPVHISVENKGLDINEASVQVSYKDFNGIATIYGADISLPGQSRKELFIYVYYPQSGVANLNVELIANKKVLTKTSARVSSVPSESLVIGLMANTPSNYSKLSQVGTAQSGMAHLVQLQPASLPDKAQGWETLDAILISDVDTGVLTTAQLNALELWIAKGGTLITVGGPKWQATIQGVDAFLPIQVTSTAHVTAPVNLLSFQSLGEVINPFTEETEAVLATGTLLEDSQVLATQGDVPLVIEKKIGRGKSIFFAADPGLAPYKNWDGTLLIYNGLLNFKPTTTAWLNGHWETSSANEAVTAIAELAIPSIVLICALMAFYIVLVGPVNYLFLRIIKKREWAWISIPLIVLVVSVLSYIYGYFYRGQTPTLNRLTVIQAWDGVSMAEKDTLVGIYSPQRDTYTLESEDGFLLYPYNFEDTNLQGKTAWLSMQSGQNTNVPEIPIEIGGMKVIGTSGSTTPLDIEHDLTISFENGNARLNGTVTNNTNVTISDLNLVTPARWKIIGDLAPGESAKIDLSMITTPNSPEFYFGGSVNILQTSYTVLQVNEELRRREAFLRSVITPEYGENNSNWGIYLIGWLNGEQSSAALADFKSKNTDTTLYIHQITPAIITPQEQFTLTTALLEWQSNSEDASPYYAYSYNLPDFMLRFRPAIPVEFDHISQLKLNLDSYAQPNVVEVSLWDFTLNDWDILGNVNWGTYNVPNPENYISTNGDVIIRIKDAQSYGYLEMKRVAISLVVTP